MNLARPITMRNHAWISSDFWSLPAVIRAGKAVGLFARAASWCAAHSPVHRFVPREIAERCTEQLTADAAELERSGLFVAAPGGWVLGLEQHVRLQAVSP